MNGQIPGVPPVKVPNPVADLLEMALERARRGELNTVAILMVEPDGKTAPVLAGGRLGDAYVCASVLQKRILEIIAPAPDQKPGRILQVRG